MTVFGVALNVSVTGEPRTATPGEWMKGREGTAVMFSVVPWIVQSAVTRAGVPLAATAAPSNAGRHDGFGSGPAFPAANVKPAISLWCSPRRSGLPQYVFGARVSSGACLPDNRSAAASA